jgi:hypothetical protein
VDPESWTPAPDAVMTPAHRNRMAMIRWALAQCAGELDTRSGPILGLANSVNGNLLQRRPETIARHSWDVDSVAEALGGEDRETLWETMATLTERTCETCELGGIDIDAGDFGLCSRWRGLPVETCENWIGEDDPVVLPVGNYHMRRLLESDGVAMVEVDGLPDPVFCDAQAYAAAVLRARELDAAEDKARQAAAETGHLDDIRAYQAWQEEQAIEDLGHFQAHACRQCKHMHPLNEAEGMPPCYFAKNPLPGRWGDNVRAPYFGVLVSEEGLMLPRCEMFAYTVKPPLR